MSETKTKILPLSPIIDELKPSATLLINEKSRTLIEAGKKVYRLGFGQSPFPVPPSVVNTLQKHAHEKDYLPVRGLPLLRAAVATFYQKKLNLDCSADEVLIGPGSKELIFNCQMAFDGDILLPSPSWVSYEPQALMLRKKMWWLNTQENNNWKITPDVVEATCQKVSNPNKLLILNYPNNPTGVSYSIDELKSLAEVFRRNNILVIADEIYGEVHHENQRESLSKFYPEGTIISEGLSKWCGAGGWRLGTFLFPKNYKWLQDAMAKIASETYSAVSAPIQYAAIEAFNSNPEIDEYLQQSKRILRAVGNYMYRKLLESDLTMPPPQGGFYLIPNFHKHREPLLFKGIKNSTQLCERLLEDTGVAILPGVAFGRPSEELTTRLSYVDFDGEKLLQLVAGGIDPNQNTFIEQHCPQIHQATLAIKNWLEDL